MRLRGRFALCVYNGGAEVVGFTTVRMAVVAFPLAQVALALAATSAALSASHAAILPDRGRLARKRYQVVAFKQSFSHFSLIAGARVPKSLCWAVLTQSVNVYLLFLSRRNAKPQSRV